jgi:enoyl-CoA hydratase/carnithine racemase
VLTARPYPAETMRDWGVVNRVVPADELLEKATSFARRLAEGPTVAHAATKRMIKLAVDEGVEAADAALPEAGAKVMASEDLQNGARALLEKGPGHATFEGR